jgi:hypothetical protein
MFDHLYDQLVTARAAPFSDFSSDYYAQENWLPPPAQMEELPGGLIPDEV